MFLVFFYVSLCFFFFIPIFKLVCVLCVFCVFFAKSSKLLLLCVFFSSSSNCFLVHFPPSVFVMFFVLPHHRFFSSSSKVSFLLHLFYVLMPFFVFSLFIFCQPFFFVNFILVFSFSFHWQSCCFDFSTLSSFCPQNFALSYLVVVLVVDSHLVPFLFLFTQNYIKHMPQWLSGSCNNALS